MSTKLIIGMMSGTSADGIDAVLVKFKSDSELEVLETDFSAFSTELRDEINKTAHAQSLLKCKDSPLHQRLANDYAQASLKLMQKAGVSPSEINAIANHGQTVRHEPNQTPPMSLQLGDAQLIADLTGVLTIADFRQADLAAGGQGAPLMPAFHAKLFGGEHRYMLNIGGIANLTQLGDTVIGFDTGPGNTLLDQWIYQHKGQTYDADGDWAASGTVIPELLNRLISDEYFSLAYPKSTGPDYFNLNWLGNVAMHKPEDVQATLLELSIQSVAGEMKQLGNVAGEVFVCGGGAHNKFMMNRLAEALPSHNIKTTDELGIPADWVEAVGFAWLGYCRLKGLYSNLPSVTGAQSSEVLGDIYMPSDA